MRVFRLVVVLMALLSLASGRFLLAQQQQKQEKGNIFAGSPLFWKTEWILDAYVAQVTRYYNLTEEQEEYTRKLMNQRVKSFLQDHEREVRSLIAEYWNYQLSQELPEPQAAQEFARRAAPLIDAARKEIFEGNMQWRRVLDEEQRAKHDRDLQQMTTFFDNLDRGLERWKHGDVRPMDVPGRVNARPTRLIEPEEAWDAWVRKFIQTYRLDEGQQQTAQSILRELKTEAARYREANKDAFTELKAQSERIVGRQPKTDPGELEKYQKETREFSQKREQLERPIHALFQQLRTRVEAIPTADQRRAREEQRVARFGVSGLGRPNTRPAAVTTAPAADTQPATLASP